jgi:hypothetical protein
MQKLTVPENFERQPHPKNVKEAAILFDKNFKGWYKVIDLEIFEQGICAYNDLFGQVFGDHRFDLYRKIFREEDEGLGDKQPKNPGIFWRKQYNQEWVEEIHRRQNRG